MNSTAARITITSIVFLLILLGGYYVGVLRPKYKLLNEFNNVQITVSDYKAPLLQNRLAFVAVSTVETNGINGAERLLKAMTHLSETNTTAHDKANKEPNLPSITGAPTKALTLLNKDLPEALTSLIDRQQSIMDRQRPLIDDMQEATRVTFDLLAYSPEEELFPLDLETQADLATSKATSIKKGIASTIDSLETISLQPAISTLKQSLNNLSDLHNLFCRQLEVNSFAEAESTRQRIATSTAKVHSLILATPSAMTRQQVSLEILLKETNLLLEYDFWLDKIKHEQAQLNNN